MSTNNLDFKNSYLVFSDGACSGNPGPGGWGTIVYNPKGNIIELGDHQDHTTNNAMEITGVLKGLTYLRNIRKEADSPVHVFSDSTYVLRGIQFWVWGWKRKNWLNAEGQPVANKDLWLDLSSQVSNFKKIHWHYLRGHKGIPANERCDQIATARAKNKYEPLFEGTLLNYSVPIFDLPEDTSLPELKPKTEKKQAYSYVSLVHGQPMRHTDWASCERRVKGQSGAKFKKTHSAEEEQIIFAEWGVNLD